MFIQIPLHMPIKETSSSKPVATWLLIGVVMIMVQVMLGGITRLTESGLSITEWKPVTGALPPLNNADWQTEFDKYKHTDQFRYIHSDFTLRDFKFIFFWEWLHRFWARLMGMVFLAGFIYFLVKKQFKQDMIIPMVILFLLGGLQGLVGWIMVKSGLVPEKLFVGHIELASHFIAALVLLCYTFWFALSLIVPGNKKIISTALKNLTIIIICILSVQLVYGAFMSGTKAATAAATWPDINGSVIPVKNDFALYDLANDKIIIQFIHRCLAYVLVILVLIWWFSTRRVTGISLLKKTAWLPPLLIIMQAVLGIFTVIRSPYGDSLVWLGLAHQFVAMLFLITMVWMLFLIRRHNKSFP